MTSYVIRYSDGRYSECDTYEQALDAVHDEYGPDAVTEHDGDLTEHGDRTLCWSDESSSVNDDGAHAVAAIHRAD